MKTPATLAVVMPTWLGDCVMATPLLRALRKGLPHSRIVAVCGGNVAPVLDGLPSLDAIETFAGKASPLAMARVLRSTHADAVVLLPNAFRSAAAAWLARVPRRIGYRRDGRGLLLTDRVAAPTTGTWPRRRHAVVPAVRHYLNLLPPLGLAEAGRRLELAITPADDAAADAVAQSGGLDAAAEAAGSTREYAPDPRLPPRRHEAEPSDHRTRPLVIFVPGGRYGSAKLWPATHFADLARRLDADGLQVALSVAPGEEAVAAEIAAASPAIDLSKHGLSLRAVKGLIARSSLVVTNDTGARHIAVALGRRVVTLFGPTDPKRTTLDWPLERELWHDVPCRPCQLKACPLPEPQTQRCLRDLTPETVLDAAKELLNAS